MTLPSASELEAHWAQKYGPVDRMGWQPTRRHRAGYYLPADVYESLVAKLVTHGSRWLDVGGGHSIFPENPVLARTLVARCAKVVAVDPSDNVHRNTFVHDSAQAILEEYSSAEQFDLATMRMVVEHVRNPESFMAALSRLVCPGGAAVVLTVSLWSPVTILSRVVPFKFHHAIKRLIWGGEEEDTFPVCYRMNTRASLRRLFEEAGFTEELCVRRDDLSVLGRFRWLSYADLFAWRSLKTVGLPYPDGCLLAVYRKRPTVT